MTGSWESAPRRGGTAAASSPPIRSSFAAAARRWECLVAQEIWRRAARRGDPVPEELLFWATKKREIDFVVRPELMLEVKRGQARPFEFSWFPRTFPRVDLRIVNTDRFAADRIRGLTMEDLLRDDAW